MRSHLLILTILWIAAGLATFPILYLMVAFANDNPTPLTRILSTYLILFYLQLIIQSFVALASLKRIGSARQYLFAVLAILLSPILLFICIPIGAQLSSNLILQLAFVTVLVLQLIGSIWMWVLIGTRGRQAVTPAVEMPTSSVTPAGPYIAQTAPPLPVVEPSKSRWDIAHILLYAPVALFVLTVALTIIVSVVGSLYPSFQLAQSSVFKFIFTSLGALLALSLLPCLIAGIYLMIRKAKS